MKILFLFVSLIVLCSSAFAGDWSLKTKGDSRQVEDTLFVNTEYTNDKGEVVTTVEVPIFQPKSYDDVLLGQRNRANTIKAREAAKDLIKSKVKPNTDKEKDKPIPTLMVSE